MNIDQLTKQIAETFKIPYWEAFSRAEFNVGELELDPNNISDTAAAEIERAIAGDIRRGK